MGYMANHFEKRIDPTRLVEGAKSVITLVLNYYPNQSIDLGGFKIARYAYGDDYHDIIRAKLRTFMQCINEDITPVHGRGFVDSAPVLERAWAVKSGLGWVGKNGNLILKGKGSYFFVATLIIDLALKPDPAFDTDHCGRCTQCIDACPTQAILPNKTIAAHQCISYFTIELKEAFSGNEPKWNDWIFGCDICQEVCPWNRFSTSHQTMEFEPNSELIDLKIKYTRTPLTELSHLDFSSVFKKSPLKRAGYDRFMRNIDHVLQKNNMASNWKKKV
ncbi:MAG: tRNA epoxyqueuosine(34) reductase QueG, partial [Chitinophagaceae bacterium]|nr:tRNA epoxyqueuosine(34) reductase QueG [Chitinophagaceae bacterium]